jgi:hypothetical protein
MGTATGVTEGTYGAAQTVGKFTVDLVGRITYAEDVDIQVASETLAGIAQVATQAVVDAGTDDTAIVTPLKLHTAITGGSINSSDIQLSTAINGNVDVQSALQDAIYDLTSTGGTIAITSASTGLFNVEVAQATETLIGGAEIATQSEVDTGTDDTRIVTPLKLANAPVAHVVSAPSASSDAGSLGQVAFGGGFFYYYDGTQWLQVAGSTF